MVEGCALHGHAGDQTGRTSFLTCRRCSKFLSLQVWWSEPCFTLEAASSSTRVSLPRLPSQRLFWASGLCLPHTRDLQACSEGHILFREVH